MKHVPAIRLGTRGSALARWQADWVAAALKQHHIETEIVVIKTHGDSVQNQALIDIGAQGLFTREIQKALQNDEIDIAVHSLKDLPTDPAEGLYLAAVPQRGAYRDAFLSNNVTKIEELPRGARIGTGSLRRRTQIQYRWGDSFQLLDVRGNVETRLRKLDAGEYDALILAEAGLQRLGFSDRIRSYLAPPDFLPAAGQGALGIEVREAVRETMGTAVSDALSCGASFKAAKAERAFLRTLQGGCIAPIGVFGSVTENTLNLHGRILSPDGTVMLESSGSAPAEEDPERLGIKLADVLQKRGADKIIEQIQMLRR